MTITTSSSARCGVASDVKGSRPVHGFALPPKGFFVHGSSGDGAGDDNVAARSPSMAGPMRRKLSDFSGTAQSAGRQSIATPIPMRKRSTSSASRGLSISPRLGPSGNMNGEPGSLSTSFGAAAEALSISSNLSKSHGSVKPERSMGHSHFGQECFGPGSGDPIPPPPSSFLSTSAGAATTSELDEKHDDSSSLSHSHQAGHSSLVHRCESCSKVYRHPSCLVKHRWEHTVYWKEASKFLMSKHQQVQLLEAAAILVGMDESSNLPEEKALWPAAVSPPSSGLLGSDKVNFEKLMALKARGSTAPSTTSTPSLASGQSTRRSDSTSADSPSHSSSGSGGEESSARDREVSALSLTSRNQRLATLSPLNRLSDLRINNSDDVRSRSDRESTVSSEIDVDEQTDVDSPPRSDGASTTSHSGRHSHYDGGSVDGMLMEEMEMEEEE